MSMSLYLCNMVMRIKMYREKQEQTKTIRYQCYLINPLRVEILERKKQANKCILYFFFIFCNLIITF